MLIQSFPYKICDPVHGFIRFDAVEKELIDSLPFQRLRYLHQMGLAYLVYPGATHSRFEHSLGVMELATRVYDTLTLFAEEAIELKSIFPSQKEEWFYWRRILRLAALCHDIGHLPFSHTAEKELLPVGGHEKKTADLIQSDCLAPTWKKLSSSASEDVLKLAIGEKSFALQKVDIKFSKWEKVLSQIITDDNFGADRIDYLIRDARQTGVGYGSFDFHQLIDSLRILPSIENQEILTLGIFENGLQSVESLWMARYLMYSRVYYHSKVKLYNWHMSRFMTKLFKHEKLDSSIEEYLRHTDFTILAKAAQKAEEGDRDAQIVLKQLEPYEEIPVNRLDEKKLEERLDALKEAFGKHIHVDVIPTKNCDNTRGFSVLTRKGELTKSIEMSPFLNEIPHVGKNAHLFASREYIVKINEWLNF